MIARFLRLLVAPAAVAVVAVGSSSGGAVTLPPQVPPVAETHTHGADGLWLDHPQHGDAPAAAPYDVDAHAPWNASDWDGKSFSVDQPDLSTLPQFHAIYVYPKNGTNRFAQFAAMFQADTEQASARLAALYNRAIRFDYRTGDCYGTPGKPCLDITVYKSKSTARQLDGSAAWSSIYRELSGVFKAPNKKYFVFLDTTNTYACGQGNLSQDTQRTAANANEGRTQAIVYRPYDANNGEGGFCRGRTLMHELGHNMGALQKTAPHAFDGAHCNDSAEDVMCYTSQTSNDTGSYSFDYNNDDYWDPIANPALGSTAKLPWWTVNLSRYVCPVGGDCSSPNQPEF
ncbi:MAG TPA: hypothetical protein VFK89_05020 [Actinomycetota bacterium]|nr:hypothetical protein [Actinomycetota bacterium]